MTGDPPLHARPRVAFLGLGLHFFIALVAAAGYYVASRALPAVRQRPLVFGALYGVAVYAFMNFVVLPLSAVARRPFSPGLALVMVAVHVACVGIPIALATRGPSGRRRYR